MRILQIWAPFENYTIDFVHFTYEDYTNMGSFRKLHHRLCLWFFFVVSSKLTKTGKKGNKRRVQLMRSFLEILLIQ